MYYPIAFLNTTTNEQGTLIPAEETLAISTLRYWLLKDGINNTAVFPESPGVDLLNVRERFEEFTAENNAGIYAISCWSSSYATALMYAEIIRYKRSEAVIIGGGAHFHSRDNIYKALIRDGFDIVFQGGAEPFFEFCRNLFIDKTLTVSKSQAITLKGQVPKEGIFYADNGELKLGRPGLLAKAVVPVIQITDSYAEITALFSDECGNNCDYCSVFKNRFDLNTKAVTEELITSAFHRLSNVWNGPVLISIMDSNPFLDKNRQLIFESIKRLAALDNRISFSVLADPVDLDEEFIAFSKENRIKIFFIGRDRISEDSFVGRRLKGRLRTQRQLDQERRDLAEFIRAMNGTYCDLFIGYIASPFDTAQSAAKLAEEIKYYMDIAQTASVIPNIFILNPYGGTSVHKKAGKNAWDISEFSYPYPNVWNGIDTEMIWLELLRLTVAPVFAAGGLKMGLFLLEFAAYCAFGSPFPSSGGFTEEMKSIADNFTENVSRMGLGNESSLNKWQKHICELRHWGLMMSVMVRAPGMALEYGMEWLASYIINNDNLAEVFNKDLRLIASKELRGTWYERWAER
jgi:hypothetical protein